MVGITHDHRFYTQLLFKVNKNKFNCPVGVFITHRFYYQTQQPMAIRKLLTLLTLALAVLTGCQQEADEIRLPAPSEAFGANSIVAAKIKHVAMRDGSQDNILDGNSCASIMLPVTVLVNGQELVISTEEDFKLIERILDESDSDSDVLTLAFPVTLIRADYTEVSVTNQDVLESYMDACVEDGLDDDIECIDFKFPIKLTIYNTSTLISKVVTIESDEQLYEFIELLKDNELVSFKFPVTLLLTDGSEIIVNDVEELEIAIENAEGECDEDDDNDFDDDDIDTGSFEALLTSGAWQIEYYFDEINQTTLYASFTFTFNADGTIAIVSGVNTYSGQWIAYGDNGTIELDLELDGDELLNKLNEDWDVNTFSESLINLKDDLEDAEPKVLTFKKL